MDSKIVFKKSSLERSFFSFSIQLYLFQILVSGCISLYLKQSIEPVLVFSALNFLYHSIFCCFLCSIRYSFVNDNTGDKLSKINTANRITCFRISTLPTVIYFMLTENDNFYGILILFLCFIFLTDFLDGFIARKFNQRTKAGRILDSCSDYLVLFSIAVVFCIKGLIEWWLLMLLIIRILVQGSGMLYFIIKKTPMEPRSTPGGKVAIAGTMIYLVISLASFTWFRLPVTLKLSLEILLGAILFFSNFEKIFLFLEHGKKTGVNNMEPAP